MQLGLYKYNGYCPYLYLDIGEYYIVKVYNTNSTYAHVNSVKKRVNQTMITSDIERFFTKMPLDNDKL